MSRRELPSIYRSWKPKACMKTNPYHEIWAGVPIGLAARACYWRLCPPTCFLFFVTLYIWILFYFFRLPNYELLPNCCRWSILCIILFQATNKDILIFSLSLIFFPLGLAAGFRWHAISLYARNWLSFFHDTLHLDSFPFFRFPNLNYCLIVIVGLFWT